MYPCPPENENYEHSKKFFSLPFQLYAFPYDEIISNNGSSSCLATLKDYRDFFDLKIGLYVQEFSIGPECLDILVQFVNEHHFIYNLGLAWGGINGKSIKNLKGDGFWNQRFVGRNWDFNAKPQSNMKLLAPEDNNLFEKSGLVTNCGHVTTVHNILNNEETVSLATRGICSNPMFH